MVAHLRDPAGTLATDVRSSRAAHVSGSSLCFALELAPHAEWDVRLSFRPQTGRVRPGRTPRARHFGEQRDRIRRSLEAWNLHVPQLSASWGDLAQAYARSVADLAALRMRGSDGVGLLPAAGMPWFMTVFGRDTIITCLQTLVFGPELAQTALRALAELQAERDDPAIDAEPGKIIHELRRGRAAEVWFPRYYGTVDATPLFLVLLSETWRWTRDDALVRELEPALRHGPALDRRVGRPRRRRPRRVQPPLRAWPGGAVLEGLARFPALRRRPHRRRPDRGERGAGLCLRRQAAHGRAGARRCSATRALAERLEREAGELRERFDRAFWVERHGGFYALALDGDKQPVDSRCSNMGHLLWSGIVPAARVADVARTLMDEPLWSGWGVRTMSAADEAYRPLAYHCGTVWPHDNSLIAHGLALRGESDASLQILRSMLEAARFFDGGLPEVFAGLARRDTPFPVAYPTASRPQAWAAGAPVLLLRVLLGLEPDPHERVLTVRDDRLPPWVGDLTLSGVPAFGKRFDVRIRAGRAELGEATDDSDRPGPGIRAAASPCRYGRG